jgi:hypothetical protein
MTKKTRKLAINSFLAITAMAWSAQSLAVESRPGGSAIGSTSSQTASPVLRTLATGSEEDKQ